jgi:amino-acid N-acetyltransferase
VASARLRVTSGNFVTAKPLGIRDGVDFQHTGEVRRVDTDAINSRLAQGEIVLISPVGYSPTGEVFNLDGQDVATAIATSLRASKLIFLLHGTRVEDAEGRLVRQLTESEALRFLDEAQRRAVEMPELECAVDACKLGVARSHLVDGRIDGALLLELFSRDGIGTMISAAPYDHMRKANIDDVGGILELIAPLETQGVLVRRSREKLEMEIDHFTLLVRDGAIIGCAALYPYSADGMGELACFAVHPDYRNAGRGDALLDAIEREAKLAALPTLFVLTTRATHWFLERGFVEGQLEGLPVARKDLYNFQRGSKIFIKTLQP